MPHEHAISHPGVLRQKCLPWPYTWVGRKPTLELEILAFLIRELVPDISDDWKTPWTFTRPELWSKSSWLLQNRRRQRSARGAMYPELLLKRETCQSPHQRARPLQVSQQTLREIIGEEFTKEEASLCVPPGRNVSTVIYCGKAWQTKLVPPRSRTATWSAVRSHRAGLVDCLSWAWEAHTELTQEE